MLSDAQAELLLLQVSCFQVPGQLCHLLALAQPLCGLLIDLCARLCDLCLEGLSCGRSSFLLSTQLPRELGCLGSQLDELIFKFLASNLRLVKLGGLVFGLGDVAASAGPSILLLGLQLGELTFKFLASRLRFVKLGGLLLGFGDVAASACPSIL